VTSQTRWLLTGAAVLVVALVGVGLALLLASDDGEDTITTGTTVTTLPPPTTAAGDDTSVTVGIICTTPEDASMSFVDAWIAGDEAAAKRCATDGAAATLFETSGSGAQWTFQGCAGPDPGVPECSYSYEGGGALLTLNGTEAAGWKVVEVSFVAD